MIEDLGELPNASRFSADTCIVGAGAAGITLALELARGGQKVCLLEGGGLKYEYLESQILYQGTSTGVPVSLDGGRLRYLGGSTNHWGGRCAPLDPIDFEQRAWIPHSGWPLTREELDPYYLRARAVAGFGSDWLPDPATLRELNVTLPAVNPAWLKPFIWHYTPPTQDAPAFRFANAYQHELASSDRIQLLLHANFTDFVVERDGRAVREVGVSTLKGVTARIAAQRFVLCCGGIENARLLLVGAEKSPTGFGNQNDLVGRYLMQHSRGPGALLVSAERLTHLQGQLNILRNSAGHEVEVGLALAPQVQRDEQLLNCSAVMQYQGDSESGVAVAQDIWRALLEGHWAPEMGEKVGLIAKDLPGVMDSALERLRSGHSLDRQGGASLPSKSAVVLLDLEQAPDPECRVTLGSERDALGLKRVQVNWRLSELERRTASKLVGLIGSEFARLGVGRCRLEPWLEDEHVPMTSALQETYHYMGATRMSDDPAGGVVDRDGGVHGMRNLFVAGSSVFPTGGQANPTLTLLALTLRLADHLKQ